MAGAVAAVVALPVPALAADWPTYHGDPQRTGLDSSSYSLSPLNPAWTTSALDGQLYASPVVSMGLVFAATENDTVYAFHVTDGAQIWKTHLATPITSSTLSCGNIGPVTGISGTPVVDPTTQTVYVVDYEGSFDHVLYALDLGTGHVKWSHEVNPVAGTPKDHQQRSALALGSGYVYVSYGGLDGDCGDYHGQVIGFKADGTGSKLSFAVTSSQAGMWSAQGPSIDGSGNVFVTSGNGDSNSFGGQESVYKLSPTLQPLDRFTAGDWSTKDSSDQDLGAMSVALMPDTGLALAAAKDGSGYLLNQSSLGGTGNGLYGAPACSTGNDAGPFGGSAYQSGILYIPCNSDGLTALSIDSTHHTFSKLWSHGGVTGTPIIAAGTVWALSGSTLVGMNPATGTTTTTKSLASSATRFSTPASSNGRIFLSLHSQLTALAGPNPANPPPGPTPPDQNLPWTGGSDAVAAPAPATQAYFAEGFTGQNFHEYLTVQNPGAAQTLTVNYLLPAGSAPIVLQHALPANSRVTIDVNQDVGYYQEVSAYLTAPNPFVAERPMYFDYPGGITGGHDVMGITQPGANFYFAEGTTLSNFYEYLTLENPSGSSAVVDLKYSTQSGSVPTKTLTLAPNSRTTVQVFAGDTSSAVPSCDPLNTCGVGRGQTGVSVQVQVQGGSPGIVVERPMYFNYYGRPGGHVASGQATLAQDLDLAEGFVSPAFDEYLTIFNPNAGAASVSVTYYIAGGGAQTQSLTVNPSSRSTIHVNDLLGPLTSSSVHVHSSQPIMVERPMYFDYNGWTGGHDAVALPSSQMTADAYLAEGSTLFPFREFLTLENPNSAAVPVNINYATDTGATSTKTLTLGPTSRTTVQVFAGSMSNVTNCDPLATCGAGPGWGGVSVHVHAPGGQPILVERPMYFEYDS